LRLWEIVSQPIDPADLKHQGLIGHMALGSLKRAYAVADRGGEQVVLVREAFDLTELLELGEPHLRGHRRRPP